MWFLEILIDEGLEGYWGEGLMMDGCEGGEYAGGLGADDWDDDDWIGLDWEEDGDDDAGDDEELTDT